MRFGLALGVVVTGCYAPQPHAGAPCPDGICPTGLVCSPATMTCETTAIDARGTDSPIADAAIDARADARPIDAPPPPAVPVLRQQNVNKVEQAASLSVTLANMPAAGNVLVMVGATPSGGLTSVTGGGATWTLATRSLVNGNEEIWFGVTNGTSATVTIARTSNAAPMWLSVTEWSGLDTTSLLVDASSTSGTVSPASPGPVTTTGPTLLVLGATDDAGNTFGAPSPGTWTMLTASNSNLYVQSEWYRVEPSAGTYTPSVTETAGGWEAAVAAFRYVP